MKMLRLRIVHAFARLFGVPIKVREEYWLGKDADGVATGGASDTISSH